MEKNIKNLGIHKNLYKNVNFRFLLNVFDKMSFSREFEKQVKINREKNLIKTLIYLSLGQNLFLRQFHCYLKIHGFYFNTEVIVII